MGYFNKRAVPDFKKEILTVDEAKWKEFDSLWEQHQGRREKRVDEPFDPVEKPSHYQIGNGIEARDIIRVVLDNLDMSPWEGYCLGNFLKYRLRAGEKDGVEQEIGKCEVYRRWLNEATPI